MIELSKWLDYCIFYMAGSGEAKNMLICEKAKMEK